MWNKRESTSGLAPIQWSAQAFSLFLSFSFSVALCLAVFAVDFDAPNRSVSGRWDKCDTTSRKICLQFSVKCAQRNNVAKNDNERIRKAGNKYVIYFLWTIKMFQGANSISVALSILWASVASRQDTKTRRASKTENKGKRFGFS